MAHTDDSNGLSAKRSVWLITVIVVAALCAIGGASLILTLGWPGTQAKTQPRLSLLEEVTSLKSLNGYQSNQALSATSVGEVEPMIKALASRLQQNPDDAEGRRMLGWSYFSTERYGNAAQAYRQAAELQGDDADLYSAYGEALVRAARGQVTTIALGVFEKTLELNPLDARARFFQGMALEQSGNVAGALDIWTDVLRTAPKDAHWIAGLRERIDELALLHSVDTKDQLRGVAELPTPSQRTGFTTPTSTEIASANALPEKERQAMIVGMVDGLEERLNNHPKDVEGWIRLIRSRLVLNDTNGAERALNRARLIFFEDPVANTRIIKAASNLGLQVN